MSPLVTLKAKWAYLSGIFDGEGCIGFWKSRGGHQAILARLRIINTDSDLIRFCCLVMNGKFEHRKGQSVGWRDSYVCRIDRREDVDHALRSMLPYLRVKRRHAELVLKYFAAHAKGSHYSPTDERLFEEMRLLNGRGGKSRSHL